MRSDYRQILEVAEHKFPELVVAFRDFGHKIRLYLVDESYIDVYLGGPEFRGRFSFHWERRHIDGEFYRYDNFPNTKWKNLDSFPYHFHKGSQNKVVESEFRRRPLNAFYDFMEFVKESISDSAL